MLKFWKNTEGGQMPVFAATIAVTVAVFMVKFTPSVLNPYNFAWMMSYGDMPTEYVSWLYFRSTPWHFPVVGTLTGYDYPTITGVGLTGAVPLLAIPMKFFTHSQTVDFQYFGWWFLLCYILQAYFSVRLLRGVISNFSIRISSFELFLGSVFIALSPALLTRTGHMNLCAQWLILWSFCTYFENKTVRDMAIAFLKISAITALVHQYLLLMVFGIGFAALLKAKKNGWIDWTKALIANVLNVGVAMFLWKVCGNFKTSNETMEQTGFGKFSANLNTFFNGLGEQKLLPTLSANEGQYEGFAYLGLGVLALGLISFLGFIFNKNNSNLINSNSKLLPLSIIAILFAFFAFSNIWFYGKTTVATLNSFYHSHPQITFLSNAFRSSGRFIWVLHYFLLFLIVIGFYKIKFSQKIKTIILVSLLALQIADIYPMFVREKAYFDLDDEYKPSVMTATVWQNILSEAERVVMLPNYVWHYKDYNDYIHFARLTALKHQSITTGYLARPDWKAHTAYENNLLKNLKIGSLAGEENSIFVANKPSSIKLKTLSESGQVRTFRYQDYTIVVPNKLGKTIQYLSQLADCQSLKIEAEGLAEFLSKNAKDNIMLISVRDDGGEKLCAEARQELEKMQSAASQLKFREAYVGVIVDGLKLFDKRTNENEKIIEKLPPQYFAHLNSPLIQLESAGAVSGNFGRIIVNGKDLSPAKRGFNILVYNKQWKLLKTASFDTYDDCYAGEVKSY